MKSNTPISHLSVLVAMLALFHAPAIADVAPTEECPTVMDITMTGGQVSGGGSPTASGGGTVVVTKVPPDLPPIVIIIRVTLSTSGLSGPVTAAHLHAGGPGQEGPVLLALAGDATSLTGSTTLTPVQYQQMLAGGVYADVHTAAFPGGELRGQVATGRTQLVSFAAGDAVVPPTTSGGTADGLLTIHADRTVTYEIDYEGFAVPPLSAELRAGAFGSNGPLVATLTQVTGGTSGRYAGTTAPLTPVQIARMRVSGTFVTLTTVAFPGGAIRGQVVPSFLPYGEPCGTPAGLTLAGSGLTRPGGEVEIEVSGGLAGGAGLLLLGPKGEALPTLGCFLYVNPPFLTLPAPLDANGELLVKTTLPTNATTQWLYLQYFGLVSGSPNPYASNGLAMHIAE